MNNPHAVNSNAPPNSMDDDIGVDWTPEIPFENVSKILMYLINNKLTELLIELIRQQMQLIINIIYFCLSCNCS